jgi:hypothetical protein
MQEPILYQEHLSSPRTEALFILLTLAPLAAAAGRVRAAGLDGWSIALLLAAAFFLFYSLNYRTLVVRLGPQSLRLRFGLFEWRIPIENIVGCTPDTLTLWRIGGAGIHFTPVAGRYRAMFNFLEHPRLVLALRKKMGPVRDIAFSTRRPAEVLARLQPLLLPASTPSRAPTA